MKYKPNIVVDFSEILRWISKFKALKTIFMFQDDTDQDHGVDSVNVENTFSLAEDPEVGIVYLAWFNNHLFCTNPFIYR